MTICVLAHMFSLANPHSGMYVVREKTGDTGDMASLRLPNAKQVSPPTGDITTGVTGSKQGLVQLDEAIRD